MSRHATLGASVLALLLAGSAEAASTLPFSDGFETYPDQMTFVTPTNSWGATANTIKVQAATAGDDSQSVLLSSGGVLSNAVDGAAITRLWTDQLVLPCTGEEPVHAADESEVLRVYFNPNGYRPRDGGHL